MADDIGAPGNLPDSKGYPVDVGLSPLVRRKSFLKKASTILSVSLQLYMQRVPFKMTASSIVSFKQYIEKKCFV